MSNPLSGIAFMLKGLRLIFHPNIRRFVIIPLLINISLFVALIVFGANQLEVFVDWIMPEVPSWLQWISWLLWLVFTTIALLIVFFSFSLLANLLGAPFNGPLAAAVEKHLTGIAPEGDPSQNFMANIVPSILGELKKLMYFALLAIPLLVLFFIPVINIAAPFLWFIFTAWMLALEYIDYPAGNHDMLFSDQKKLLSRRSFQSLGFGSVVSIMTFIPIANFIVMPTAVAAATVYWVEKLKDSEKL